MTHTIQMNSDHPALPTVPWGSRNALHEAGLLAPAYETCRRADKGHCINTNLIRGFAKLQGRKIRAPGTYKGEFHWSEYISGKWGRFIAPLSVPYAQTIDAYDHEGKHFSAPAKCPMGPVRFIGWSTGVKYTSAQIKERRDRHQARVQDGKLVPGARFRELQTPYAAAPATVLAAA